MKGHGKPTPPPIDDQAVSAVNDLTTFEVRDSALHGRGAFARIALKAGDLVGRYEGRRDWDDRLTHVFDLSDGSFIDGSDGGNATRHINHSCEPNCIAYEIEDEDNGTRWIEIEAARHIPAGTELTLDYQLDTTGRTVTDYTCRCGAARCRGTMVGAL